MSHPIWKESECVNGWLHRWEGIEDFGHGMFEYCEICHMTKFFHTQNYLDYHVRMALQRYMPRYYKEYPKQDVSEQH